MERIHTVADDPMAPREHAICESRAYRMEQRQRRSKLYLEYCCFGDLEKLIDRYNARDPVRGHIPGPFVYYVLEELLLAAEIMQHSTNLQGNEDENWRPIVHQDIKPGNGEYSLLSKSSSCSCRASTMMP